MCVEALLWEQGKGKGFWVLLHIRRAACAASRAGTEHRNVLKGTFLTSALVAGQQHLGPRGPKRQAAALSAPRLPSPSQGLGPGPRAGSVWPSGGRQAQEQEEHW